MAATQSGDKASTVRALVRGTRTALLVQLLVAVLALAATGFAMLETRKLEQIRDQLRAETTSLESVRDGLRDANQAASAGYRHWQRWLASGDRAALAQSKLAFESAIGNAPEDPIFRDQLAQILFASEDPAGALASAEEALKLAGELTREEGEQGTAPAFSYFGRVAAYQCAAGDGAGAQATLNSAGEGVAALQSNVELSGLLARVCGPVLGVRGRGDGAWSASLPADRVSAAAAATDAYKVKLIFLHIRDEADRPDAERLRQTLRARGYRVPGVELVAPPRGYSESVRYYYEQQAGEANQVAQAVSAAAAELNLNGWTGRSPRVTSLAGSYENLPRDRVEVWLAPR